MQQKIADPLPKPVLSNHLSVPKPRRVSVAPMLDWTDRHCRYFHRLLSQHVYLYTEMVTTGALLFGDQARHLDFSPSEQPVALQLGGSDCLELAKAAKTGEQWGYSEINLNCGCPSERVQKGAFGACLMLEPNLVADLFKAMRDSVSIPVTIKHRIGVDQTQSYLFLSEFVGTLYEAGCRVFIVHARNAILKGLSPKENRQIPPLKYDFAYQLKKDFPDCEIILNGGIQDYAQIDQHLAHLDGVMIGREAYFNPYFLSEIDQRYYAFSAPIVTREAVEQAMRYYCEAMFKQGVPLNAVIRHILGLYRHQPNAGAWRRTLSNHQLLKMHGVAIFDFVH